jgi:hypothetical protein
MDCFTNPTTRLSYELSYQLSHHTFFFDYTLQPCNAKDVYVMTNLLKWLEEVVPTSQKGLDALNDEGLLSSLQTVSDLDGLIEALVRILLILLAIPAHMSCYGHENPSGRWSK